jgi:hypothetical protein
MTVDRHFMRVGKVEREEMFNSMEQTLIVAQLVKNFSVFYGSRSFITVFGRARLRSISLATWIPSTPLPPPHQLTPWSRVLLKKLRVRSASQEFLRVLWIPKVHYRVRKSAPPFHIHSHMNPVHTPPPPFHRYILTSTPSGLFPSLFLTKSLCTFFISAMFTVVSSSLIWSSWKYLKNTPTDYEKPHFFVFFRLLSIHLS